MHIHYIYVCKYSNNSFHLTAKLAAPVAPRLVIEVLEKRRRIVSSTHDGSHLGLNRTNDMVASKYYWPGLFTDVKAYVSMYVSDIYHDCTITIHIRLNPVTTANVETTN